MSENCPRCWAVLPAAGIGSRMGADLPKQYLPLAGKTLIEHSLGALLQCPQIQAVVVAVHADDRQVQSMPAMQQPRVLLTEGGAQRSDSVLAGLEALDDRASPQDWVLVHDAARPCVSGADINKLIQQVTERGTGGVLAEPVVDTVKQAGSGQLVAATLDRSRLWRAQTPQMFRLGELRNALQQAAEQNLTVTDEASAMELAGHPVQLVAAQYPNLKVTVPADLELAAWYLQRAANGQTA
jgi:2-C-methyl-D-erythritol 4-phosphate cytidylyltransferase